MSGNLRILILEDIEEDVWLVERVLKKDGLKFRILTVDSEAEFTGALDSFKPQVILSDHSLPQFNSTEALKISRKKTPDTPFILVTGTVSEEFAVNSLKQGADDYVLKSNLNRLPSAIKTAIKQRNDLKMRKEAEKMLMNQNKELRKINHELDAFVYSISHNLRAPLLSSLGLVKLAKMEMNNANFQSIPLYLSKMEDTVYKLDNTLKEILDYSRNARSELRFEPIDFGQMIDECFEKINFLDHFAEIEKKISVQSTARFYSDKYRVGVILNNLISNAIKYCDPEKQDKWIEIEVKCDRKNASLKIKDNGIGIDNNYQSRIFEMFFRATEKSEGSGLGLYIVKENVEKLEGRISVFSKEKMGTHFEITLPNRIEILNQPPLLE